MHACFVQAILLLASLKDWHVAGRIDLQWCDAVELSCRLWRLAGCPVAKQRLTGDNPTGESHTLGPLQFMQACAVILL